MKYKNIVYGILSSLVLCSPLYSMKEASAVRKPSPSLITLFLRPYEELEAQEHYQTESRKAELYKNPLAISQKIINNNFNVSGTPQSLYVINGGFVNTVDHNGEVWFPRLTQNETIQLIVTRRLHPVVLRGNVVEFLTRDTNSEIAYYELQRSKDPESNTYYWEVRELPIPEDKKISPAALIIFAEPEHVYVPLGKTTTFGGPNLVLPTIYTRQGIEKAYDAFKFLSINRYFSPIETLVRIAPPQRYAQHIA